MATKLKKQQKKKRYEGSGLSFPAEYREQVGADSCMHTRQLLQKQRSCAPAIPRENNDVRDDPGSNSHQCIAAAAAPTAAPVAPPPPPPPSCRLPGLQLDNSQPSCNTLQVEALAADGSESSPDLCRFAALLQALMQRGSTYAGGPRPPPRCAMPQHPT